MWPLGDLDLVDATFSKMHLTFNFVLIGHQEGVKKGGQTFALIHRSASPSAADKETTILYCCVPSFQDSIYM